MQRLSQIRPVHAEADADGGVYPVRAFDLMHLLGYLELVELHVVDILLFKHDKVSVPVEAAQDAAVFLAPLAQPVLDGVSDVVFYPVGLVFEKLVEVVYDDDAGHGARFLIFYADIVIFGHVQPIYYAHGDVFRVLRAGNDLRLIYPRVALLDPAGAFRSDGHARILALYFHWHHPHLFSAILTYFLRRGNSHFTLT